MNNVHEIFQPFLSAISPVKSIRENDVFHCRYTDAYQQKRKGSDLRHCFEGFVVAKKVNEKILLADTFWGIGDSSGRVFRIDQIGVDIEIEYYCNLDEIEQTTDAERYYDDTDVFTITRQHGCSKGCITQFIRKGASKSPAKMIEIAKAVIEDQEYKIRSANWKIEDMKKNIEKIESGDLSVYL